MNEKEKTDKRKAYRSQRYEQAKMKRRKTIKSSKIKQLVTPIKNGKYYVIDDGNVVLSNTSKKAVLNDWATINGYTVEKEKKEK